LASLAGLAWSALRAPLGFHAIVTEVVLSLSTSWSTVTA
jgi:hypothetical protein